jgi:hypothetical protein
MKDYPSRSGALQATLRGMLPSVASALTELRRHNRRGVRRAFLCTFIRFSLGILKSQQPQSPRSEPDGQPIESSQLEHRIKCAEDLLGEIREADRY